MARQALRARLSWLGHPRIELGAAPVRLDTRKSTALLAYLSLADNPVSRERLAAMFWPDFDQVRAPANLRRSLASFRAKLPGNWLAAERDRIGIRLPEGLWVDVREVRRLVREVRGHAHRRAEACLECRALLEQAAALHRGEFLEGFTLPDCPEFDDWQLAERENLQVDRGWTLEHLAQSQAASGLWDQALGTARSWVALDRLHEPAQALLIRLLAQSGQRTAALRHYEEFTGLLQRELGAQPDPKTRKPLEQRVATGRPAPAAAAAQSSPAGIGTLLHSSSTSPSPRRKVEPFAGLLRTKLEAPQLRRLGVERRRLIDFLEEGIGRGLAVVSAPAGFGKSTLISRWASRAGMPVAWLSLDSADNDVHRFLLYCAGALDAARAGLAGATADLLGAMPPAPAQAVVASLINAVGSGGTDVALVLDDYQFIRTVDIHEAVRFLVDRKPPLLHLVIATREDPPLPIARLRTQGALTEIRADDLRFTTEEAGLYLNSSMSLSLSVENVALLSRRTEGWIAGLQMAALSLQGRGDAEAFIAAFGGTNRYILDYLAEEVFARQDDETRHFLLQTSVLGRMSAGLCEAVIGKHGAQQMLERLDRANLFLVSLDERRCWFRYHHLFGELLLHRLGQDRPAEEIRGLRIRAGDWLAVNGELPEAIEQYLAAGAFDRAAALIEGSYVEIFTRGVLDELYRWTMRMPEDLTRQRPTLGVVSAWALALAGKREAAETALRAVQSVLERPDLVTVGAVTEGLRGDVAIVQAFLSDLAGDTPRAVELAGISAGLLPGDHWMGRSIVFFILGRAAMYEGDLEGADRIFSDHLRFSVAIDNIWAISVATHFLLVLRRLQGTLHGCERLVREFEAHVDRHHSRDNCTLAKAFAAAADWMREQGRLREAEHAVSQAVRQAKEWGVPADIYYCLYFQARVQRSLGQIEEAVKSLESAQAILQTARVATPMQTTVDAERVRCWLAVGDVESAVAWAGQWGSAETLGPLSRHVQRLSVTRVNLAAARSTDELDQELAALDEVGTSVRERQWKGLLLDTQLLLAAARCRRFGPAEALDATDEAVRLAYAGDFFQTIVEEGSPIEELLRTGLDAGRWTDPPLRAYVERILRAI